MSYDILKFGKFGIFLWTPCNTKFKFLIMKMLLFNRTNIITKTYFLTSKNEVAKIF